MNIIIKYLAYILTFLLLLVSTQSCREEPIEPTNIRRIQAVSYSDLFDNFWDEMNNNYNYFFEEDYDWDDVYEIYSPKFKKLRTFKDKNADPDIAEREMHLAFKYFADIISKFRDRHLAIIIFIPLVANKGGYNSSNGGGKRSERIVFRRGMKYKYSVADGFKVVGNDNFNPIVNSSLVRKIMKDKLIPNKMFEELALVNKKLYYFLSGYLKSDPSTMYVNFNQFAITFISDASNKFPVLRLIDKKYLPEDTFEELEELDPDTAKAFKKRMTDDLDNLYNSLSSLLESYEYKEYLAARSHFLNTEDMSKLYAIKDKFHEFIAEAQVNIDMEEGLIYADYLYYKLYKYKKTPKKLKLLLNAYNEYSNIRSKVLLKTHFITNIGQKKSNLGTIVKNTCQDYGAMYDKLFNPLTKGEVKKLIIDLRGNGGGMIMDTNYFVSRFIYKKVNSGYYRTKEGNGRFNYSPWLPFEIEPSKFSIPKAIPTVILLDRGSASMSEASSLILKAQGDHVKIIGDNSAGATAALGDGDKFNGGSRAKGKYIVVYMPNMAYKTLDGKVIEGEGITPDIKVIPTKEEVKNMKTTRYDPVFEQALEEIRKMTVN